MKKVAFVATVALLMFARGAAAQSAVSQQLFQDGVSLLKAGNVHEACSKFAESERIEPQLGTLLNLASCHEKEGKLATAWTEYAELVDASAKKADAKRGAYAKNKVRQLDPLLPRLKLEVPSGTTDLSLDGAALGPAAWSAVIPLDPGNHTITYGAPGKKTGNVQVSLTASQTTKYALPALENAEPPPATTTATTTEPPPPAATPRTSPPPTSSAPSAPPPTESGRSGLRTGGYIVAGVGVVGLGVGAVFGAVALGDKGTVTKDCAGAICSSSGLDAVSAARRDAAVSTTGFIAGGACLAAGLAMIYLGRDRAPRVGVVPYATDQGAFVSGFGTF